MAVNLFPEGYENEVITVEDITGDSPIGYRRGVSFDEYTGDFRRDGMNKLLDAPGIESWKSWCINCLSTERYNHLAYSSDFGIETKEAMKASTHDEAESILSRQITEAIMADPYQRAVYVEDIEFNWTASDSVEVSVTIQGIDDVTIDITINIQGGES